MKEIFGILLSQLSWIFFLVSNYELGYSTASRSAPKSRLRTPFQKIRLFIAFTFYNSGCGAATPARSRPRWDILYVVGVRCQIFISSKNKGVWFFFIFWKIIKTYFFRWWTFFLTIQTTTLFFRKEIGKLFQISKHPANPFNSYCIRNWHLLRLFQRWIVWAWIRNLPYTGR